MYDKIYTEEQKRTIVLETNNSRYHVVPARVCFGYYAGVTCGVHEIWVKDMPVKAKLETGLGLLEWVDLAFEDEETTDSE